MNFIWNETKRATNLKKYELDFFADAVFVFEGEVFTFEDDRFAYDEQRFISIGLLQGIVVVIAHTEDAETIRVISMRKAENMNSNSTLPTVDQDDLDEAPLIRQADLDRAVYRVNLQSMPRKQKISITLDPDVVAFFKAQAGERGYQTLINAALREAMQQRTLETLLRQVIREELHPT